MEVSKVVRRRLFGRGGAALALSVALAAGAPAAVPTGMAVAVGGDQVVGAGEIVLPAADRTGTRNPVFIGFGDTGVLSNPEGSTGWSWTDYTTRRTRQVTEFAGTQQPSGLAQSDTTYTLSTDAEGGRVVRFRAMGSGEDRGSVTVPAGLTYAGTAGEGVVVAYRGGLTNVRELHLLKQAATGGTEDTQVTGWPADAKLLALSGKDDRSLLLRYRVPTEDPQVFLYQLALVDVRDGTWTKLFAPYNANSARLPVLNEDYVGWWYPGAGARLLRRDALDGPVITVPFQGTEGKTDFTIVGDDVVVATYGDATRAVLTRPLTDTGEWRTLIPQMDGWVHASADGSAVVVGGPDKAHWAMFRLSEAPDGQIVADELMDLPPVPAPVDGLSLAGGTLAWTDQTSSPDYDVMFNTRTVSADAVPQVGPVRQAGGGGKPCIFVNSCVRLFSAGDGSVVYNDWDNSQLIHRRTPAGEVQTLAVDGFYGEVSAAQGRYALLSGGSNRKHFLVDWTQSKVVSTHTAVAATLWDGQLWITKSTAGHLSMSRLGSTAAAVDVNVGSACVPSELQVNGRFVYWACAAQKKAGVFDRSRGRSVAVPEGDVLLADGFLVRHDNARGKLVRTDVRSGQAVNSDLADLPATKNLMPEGSTSDRRVRWTLDPDSGRAAFVDSGERIHLMPAGTLAAPVRRDHVGRDGIGDLLTLSSSGALTFQQSTGNGAFSDKVSGSGWPTSIKAVPFGDLDGDRCNDVLVRLSSGALRAYKPGCGAALKPSTPYTSLGTSGWIQYDVLTAPGDLTKDGRPDLIARNSSTGTVYLYKGTSTGTLSAPVKLYDNWKTYKKIIGAGDLNGDGIGDLLAQDTANNLYRYYGTGNGTFGARTKVFSNWGGSYNVIVGVGDISGDGKADLVSRDSVGTLWRNNGDGKGSFRARVKVAIGWQGYKGFF
ncbi:VCBS repeat-containing protein [Streptomyces europaeiscabiei]|uniref:FG-GAP repeat domain-containing protein n=1 Tax=Streptomyces europaeiscabiei TaxID=146819 RepID=UPI0029A20AD0|nr:VCBS repeat-containing protein [Streptomyces europaeiscabiei]MDX3697786.1 VCBS repeat-containing protein [Streptomyces europaeiscabiei]